MKVNDVLKQLDIAHAWLTRDPDVKRDMTLVQRAKIAKRVLEELAEKLRAEA